MASLSNGPIYNTQLFNVVLEAMDNFKPILFCESNGGTQIFPEKIQYVGNTSNGFQLFISCDSTYCTIYPSMISTTADLYTPQNITPTSPGQVTR